MAQHDRFAQQAKALAPHPPTKVAQFHPVKAKPVTNEKERPGGDAPELVLLQSGRD